MSGAFCYFTKKQFIKRFTLNKKERIKKQKVIEYLFSEGQAFVLYPFRIYYFFRHCPDAPGNTGDGSVNEPLLQFGVGVGKKHFKKAVQRNRIKRLVREAYRTQKLPLLEALTKSKEWRLKLFFIYTGKEMPEHSFIKSKVANVLQRMEKEIPKRPF